MKFSWSKKQNEAYPAGGNEPKVKFCASLESAIREAHKGYSCPFVDPSPLQSDKTAPFTPKPLISPTKQDIIAHQISEHKVI